MCFSATASFGTAVALIPAGVYCIWQAARKDPRYVALAATPLVFSIQQFCEGAVWLELAHGTAAPPGPAELAYLFFALAFWPFWLPFSVSRFDRAHRGLDLLFAVAGLTIGLCLYAPIVLKADRFLSVAITHHSISYDLAVIPVVLAMPAVASRAIYLSTVAIPLLLCAHRGFRLFGWGVLLSGIATQLIVRYAYISVWCLFAALLSCYLCVCFRVLPVRVPIAQRNL